MVRENCFSRIADRKYRGGCTLVQITSQRKVLIQYWIFIGKYDPSSDSFLHCTVNLLKNTHFTESNTVLNCMEKKWNCNFYDFNGHARIKCKISTSTCNKVSMLSVVRWLPMAPLRYWLVCQYLHLIAIKYPNYKKISSNSSV